MKEEIAMRKMCVLGGITIFLAALTAFGHAHAAPQELVKETIATFYNKNEEGSTSRVMTRELAPGKSMIISLSHSENNSLLILIKDARSEDDGCEFYLIDEEEDGFVDRSGKMCDGVVVPEDAAIGYFSEDAPFVFVKNLAFSFDFPKTTVSPQAGTSFFDKFGGPNEMYEEILNRAVMLSPF